MGIAKTRLAGRAAIAEYLEISPTTLDGLRKGVDPPPISLIGKRILIADMLELDRWVRDQRETKRRDN